ncbi:LLM class flavin-dependent oxidoreductase [Streptomyces sp. NPDC056486]|uniref:LLM class flavin-dependent oxidoreductase n=1 Tax=Streptomyces sp. NPDC056486 TaxID=3345835 RepID=UPI0036AA25DE
MPPVPLSVLDLVPVSSGSDAPTALRNTVELARAAEDFGYRRYWLAEHHLNPGVAGSAPALVIQAVAQATREIRVGSGAVLLGHQTPLSVVEQFGILDALYPGRIDLGLGRSGRPRSKAAASGGSGVPAGLARLLRSPRFQLQFKLLQQPGAQTPAYDEQVGDILALFGGTYRGDDGTEAHAIPGDGADVDVWVLGSSAGESAEVAGARGLPFGANYHVSPGTVVEAVNAYRAAFRPSAALSDPYVLVSADAVVGPDDESARRLAAGYAPWVRSIRRAEGAITFPTPEEADRLEWTEEDRELVADRVDTQFVGGPETVTEGLAELQQATGADELLITTITHDHADRVRSYELLAQAWQKQS